jgi:hypothetical protein
MTVHAKWLSPDGGFRGNKTIDLDEALERNVLVLRKY